MPRAPSRGLSDGFMRRPSRETVADMPPKPGSQVRGTVSEMHSIGRNPSGTRQKRRPEILGIGKGGEPEGQRRVLLGKIFCNRYALDQGKWRCYGSVPSPGLAYPFAPLGYVLGTVDSRRAGWHRWDHHAVGRQL